MLKLHNTLTGELEPFKPRSSKTVKMFTCGPSIYQCPHIGNYRTFLFEDLLQRYLEYLGFNVTRVLALTDVEDKSIAEAEKEKVPLKALTENNAKIFFEDMKLLKIKPPTYAPRSSTTVNQAIEIIKKLIRKGLAYKYDGNVYFDPLKFKDFGKLSKLDMNRWPNKRLRFHRDTYPGIRWNRGDFILWHGYKKGDKVYWESEIGKGRPSWNVQDAAMVTKHLGPTIDVACGGIDNLARHHDYTIAIVEGIFGKEFAHYWLHGAHLHIDSKKMSKSRGNVQYIDDLLETCLKAEYVRFFLIYEHYRRTLNYTSEKLQKTCQMLSDFKEMIDNLTKAKSLKSGEKAEKLLDEIFTGFENGINDDLNVKKAFNNLFSVVSKLDELRVKGELSSKDAYIARKKLKKVDQVLQVIL